MRRFFRHTLILALAVITCLVLFMACSEKHDTRLDGLEELMATAPDSALNFLQDLPESTLATDFDKARYAMLLMMAKDKCYIPLEPDSALLWANEVFHKRKDLNNEIKSRYYAGLAFRHVQDYREALWEALHAIDLSHEAADTFWMGRAHNLAYEIYSATYDWHNAAIEADKAAIFFKRSGAERFHHFALIEKTIALNNRFDAYTNHPSEQGGLLLDSIIDIFKLNNDSVFLIESLLQKGSRLNMCERYEQSQQVFDSLFSLTNDRYYYIQSLPFLISNGLYTNRDVTNLLSQFEQNAKSRKDTIHFLYQKEQFAVATQDWKTATLMADSIIDYTELLLGEKTFYSVDEIKSNYQEGILKERQMANQQLHKRHSLLVGCIILLIIVCYAIYLYFRRESKRKEDSTMGQIMDMMAEQEFLRKEVEYKETLQTENDHLKAEIASQNEHLKQTEMLIKDFDRTSAIDVSLRRLNLLGTRIDTICNLGMEYYECEANPRYKNEVYNRIKKEIDTLRSNKSQSELVKKINEIHSGILDRMKEQLPSTVKGDVTWIAMIIGGFQPNTICFLLNLNKNTFYSQRRRLKLAIENSSAPDKNEFLSFFK